MEETRCSSFAHNHRIVVMGHTVAGEKHSNKCDRHPLCMKTIDTAK